MCKNGRLKGSTWKGIHVGASVGTLVEVGVVTDGYTWKELIYTYIFPHSGGLKERTCQERGAHLVLDLGF